MDPQGTPYWLDVETEEVEAETPFDLDSVRARYAEFNALLNAAHAYVHALEGK